MRKVCLVVVRGVFVEDLIDPQTVAAPDAQQKKSEYTALPIKFCGFSSWPTQTNLFCWNCGEQNRGRPLFVPVSARLENGDLCCNPMGHFDSWGCAASYVEREFAQALQWDLQKSIVMFASAETKKEVERVTKAPPKYAMQKYCGPNGISAQKYLELAQILILRPEQESFGSK